MKAQFEQMMDGLNDVEAFLAGEQEGLKSHVPQEVDVKAIRNRLGMTQATFSDTFGFSLDAIKHWEGGRRNPDAPARTLLNRQESRGCAHCAEPRSFATAVALQNPTTVHVRGNRKRRASGRVTKRNAYSARGRNRITT
jgi:putative transcriptional regulator